MSRDGTASTSSKQKYEVDPVDRQHSPGFASPKRGYFKGDTIVIHDMTPIQQDFPEVPSTPSPNLGNSLDSIHGDNYLPVRPNMLRLGDAVEFIGGTDYIVSVKDKMKTKQYPWWLGPKHGDGRGGITKGVYIDENESEPPVKVKWGNGRTYWVHYKDIRRDPEATRKVNLILQRTWSSDSRPFGNPEDQDEERIFLDIMEDADATKEIAQSIQQMHRAQAMMDIHKMTGKHDILDCYGTEFSIKCVAKTLLLTAVYANDVFFNTFCMYLAYLASRRSGAEYVYGLLGINWYLTLWFVIYYMSVTDDLSFYNPLTSTNMDLASAIATRYFPLLAIFGILVVPIGIVAIPVFITDKIVDARHRGNGALAHSMQMAVCAFAFAMVFVYLFCGVVLLGMFLAALALTFSSAPLLVYSSRKYASPQLFLYENISRFSVSWCFAVPSLFWIPSTEHKDWWLIALFASGVCELCCMYYRWWHISDYPSPPPKEENMVSNLERVGKHTDSGMAQPKFTPIYVEGI